MNDLIVVNDEILSGAFKVVDQGSYPAAVQTVVVEKNADSGKVNVVWDFLIVDGDFENEQLRLYTPTSPKGMFRTNRVYFALTGTDLPKSEGGYSIDEFAEVLQNGCLGIECIAVVELENYEDKTGKIEKRSRVAEILPVSKKKKK